MKILKRIEEISDPRMIGKVQHSLSAIIFVSLCGVLSGCEDWNDIHDYCKVKKGWLSQYVSLKNGIPSTILRTVLRKNYSVVAKFVKRTEYFLLFQLQTQVAKK